MSQTYVTKNENTSNTQYRYAKDSSEDELVRGWGLLDEKACWSGRDETVRGGAGYGA